MKTVIQLDRPITAAEAAIIKQAWKDVYRGISPKILFLHADTLSVPNRLSGAYIKNDGDAA